MKQKMQLWHVLIVCGLFSTGCENRNFVVDPATVCRCDAGVDGPCLSGAQEWRHTVDNLLEVSAGDAKGNYVGTECQGETGIAWDWPPFYFNSWRPVDGIKRSMSATLHHFNWNYDDDEDWNLHIVPTPPFSFLIEEVEALHDESVNDHKVCGDLPCMNAEISPDKQFWSNPWFFAPGVEPADTDDNGYSWLEGRQMGLYGLWIMDANHDFTSEIHPAEMMWFKDRFEGGIGGSAPLDIFWLLFMQDNTGRFDDRDNFDCDGDAPAGWEPWAQSPRSGQFNIAFEVNPASEVVNFSIVELFKRFVVTHQDANARRDADDGKSHALEYNGRVVVQVEEGQPNDNDLGVTFTNICLRPDGKLQGFVSIRSKIGGDDDKDEEGFHILYAARSSRRSPPFDVVRPDIAELPRLLITSKEVGGSLRDNGNHFTGDLVLTLHGNGSTTESDYTLSKIEFAGQDIRQEIRFEQNRQTNEVLIRNLPLVSDGRVIITSRSALSLTVRTPALSLSPGIGETITRSAVDAAAWEFLSASLGGIPSSSLSNDKKLVGLQELQLKVDPRYAALKGTERMTDKSSAFAGEINQAIRENEQRKLEELLKSAQPFTIEWTFEATDLATGKPVVVSTDKSAADGVQIELSSGNLRNDSVKIRFVSPGRSGIIECKAKASVTDALGKTAIAEHRFWSHGFVSTIKSIEECASLVQSLTGLKDTAALIAPYRNGKAREISLPEDVKTRRIYVMDAYLRETARDGQITIGELRNIVRALKKFSVI